MPLADIEYAYGFGVYETVCVSKGRLLFLDEHCRRLMESARMISLHHHFTEESVARSAEELVSRNGATACNLKILLIGGASADKASLNLLCLNPLFPDRKLYRQGAPVITEWMERPFPHAKTLNMLPSYLARRGARAAGAYEALLVDRHGHVTEGTSTNFFALKDNTVFSPPAAEVLLGVTRDKVLKIALRNGFKVKEKDLGLKTLEQYDDLFLTGTVAKIMPIRSVDGRDSGPPGSGLRGLMDAYNDFLSFDN